MSLPVSLPELFSTTLTESRRPPDGLLHASSDLVGSLRHSQLRAAGAPQRPSSLADEIVLMTGTLWHDWAHKALVRAGLPFMQEVKLTRWLPEGWSGTADWVFFDPDRQGFVLGDMKTIKGSGLAFVERDGAKLEHMWQLSAYWWALYDMGLPLVQSFSVLYWPKDRGDNPNAPLYPIVQECDPLPRELVHEAMAERWALTSDYLNALHALNEQYPSDSNYLNDRLAPEQDRVQKSVWSKDHWDLKFVPHWSSRFCPFEPPLCSCSEQGDTKIGTYSLAGEYTPRKGYEDIQPEAAPTPAEIKRRRKGVSK